MEQRFLLNKTLSDPAGAGLARPVRGLHINTDIWDENMNAEDYDVEEDVDPSWITSILRMAKSNFTSLDLHENAFGTEVFCFSPWNSNDFEEVLPTMNQMVSFA
jgi:hypothetical protein